MGIAEFFITLMGELTILGVTSQSYRIKEVERPTVWKVEEEKPQEKSELMDRNPGVLQTPFRES